MATIGLRMDHGTAGTDLASVLAKALRGDPTDDFNYAKLMSTLQNDELSRRETRERTSLLTQQTLEQWQKNQTAHADELSKDPAILAADQIGVDIMGRPIVKPASSEAPVVVADGTVPVPVTSPGPIVPAEPAASPFVSSFPSRPDYVPRSEPDFNYPVSAFPLRSTEPPVPVEPAMPPLPPQLSSLLPPELYRKQEQPPMPPALAGLPAELQPPPPMPPLPPLPQGPQGVPPELQDQGILSRLNAWHPPGEQAMNDTGQNLLSKLFGTSASAEAPVAVDQSTPNAIVNALDTASATPPGPPLPPDYFPPPATLDLPAAPPPQQGPPIAAGANYTSTPVSPLDIRPQDLPVEVQPPDTSALAGVPPELRANESIALPGRNLAQPEPPVSLEAINPVATTQTPTSVPTGPPLAPPPPPDPNAGLKAGTGDALPAGAPTPPAQTLPGTVVGADGGKNDTADTVQTAAGPLSRDQVHAMNTWIIRNAKSAEDGMQAVQRFWGTLGATYNPEFGKDPTKTANIAALEGGGGAVSKDAAVLQKPDAPGKLLGTGIEPQDRNTMTRVNTQTTPATREDAIQYELAYNNAYRTPHDYSYLDEKGNTRLGQRYNPAPLGIKTPEQVYQDAGIPLPTGGATTAPKPNALVTTPATAATATSSPSAATPATAAGAAATPAVAATTAANTDPVTKSGTDTQPAEAVLKDRNFYLLAKAADGELRGLDSKNSPSSKTAWLTDPNIGGGSGSGRIETGVNDTIAALASSPSSKRFWHAATAFSAPILRKESGLATRPEDMKTIMTRYIELSDDPQDVKELKALSREIALEGLAKGAYQVDKGATDAEKLAEVDAYVQGRLAEMKRIQKNAAPDATAPATTAPATKPAGKGKLVKGADGNWVVQ